MFGHRSFCILHYGRTCKKLLEEELTVDEALEEKNLQLVRYAREHQPIQYFKLKEKYGKLKIGVRDLEKC